jgi:hypothetical protein
MVICHRGSPARGSRRSSEEQRNDNSTVCDDDPLQGATAAYRRRLTLRVLAGMIGFDIACETARSGSRIQGYLVNDL